MISETMMFSLEERIDKQFSITFDQWKQKYPTAYEILCKAEIIGESSVDLPNVTRQMYRLANEWKWFSNAKDDLLKITERGTQYDCHSISRALAKLCWLLGYSKHSYEDCIKKFPQGGDVFWLEYDNGRAAVVLPKDHLNSSRLLRMPDGTTGEDSCGGHFVWTDHRFVVIYGRVMMLCSTWLALDTLR
jgi:hypothetical protein